MITKLRIDAAAAAPEFGMLCQRLIPWAPGAPSGAAGGAGAAPGGDEPPVGAMACFLEPGRDSAPDRHDQVEVMVVLTGSGAVSVDGDRVPLGAGDLVVLPRNREHVVHNTAGDRLSWVSVYWPLHEPAPAVAP